MPSPMFESGPPRRTSMMEDTQRFSTHNTARPGSSSPTTRLSARKQRNVHVSQSQMPQGPDSSPSFQSSSNAQAGPQPLTPFVHGIPLFSLRQVLPDKFRAIFPYELLNAVQSKCFDVVYRTNDNVVVAAPTGSGKTAILELAICKLAFDRGNENFKIVYQAPTKALCSERARDWDKKFSHMNLRCAELTGDTSQAEMRRVGDASIIVTTPEKWDSITRKWQDHRKLLQMVELFLLDEVHILKDVRGATLEAVVSRMKTIGANVRFIALSATVPNSEDIARWLGRNHTNQQLPALREVFGEEFRPVKLQKFVYGFESNGNDFIFDKFLDQKLPGLIARHAQRKPILVFCFTRKSCESTAAMLADFVSGRPDGDRLWPVPSQRVPVISRELQEIVKFGVAFHHAGLDAQDRAAVEQNFLKGQLGVICCTSTLAVGINLPCHTVVLKGTVGFTDDKLEEYSDLEVMQMLGRAGRPQFDDSATAIILTRAANKQRYQKMVSGQEILESTLHLNLIEHLNSEICLGTIHNLSSAKAWLAGTFLSVRLRRNPGYYQLTDGTTNPLQIDDRLEEICERDIKQLQEAELVTDQDTFRCTEYGRAMSKYMVQFDTMKLLLKIPRGVGMEVLITILSQASEFKEFRFKPAERQLFREINRSPFIMYPIKEQVNQTHHKVSLLVQSHLGCVQYPDSGDGAKIRRQLMLERKLVFERLNRLVRAVIDCKGYDRDSVGTKTALELARALAAEAWEGRATQLTQVPNIGPVGMRKLASKDIRTVLQLADKEYDEIERLMSRQPPFGKNLKSHLDRFPRLSVEATVVGHRVQPGSEEPVVLEIKATLRYLNRMGPPNWLSRVPTLTFLTETNTGTLVYFWRGSMRKLDNQSGFDLRFSVGLRNVKEQVICHLSCEEIVGTIVTKTLEHKVPASAFLSRPAEPRMSQPRQVPSHEYFDNDDIDDSDLILAAERAANQPSMKLHQHTTAEQDTDEYPFVEELIELDGTQNEAADRFADYHRGGDEEDTEATNRGPLRLPNGKWQCNHSCSGGAPTKSGKPCSHRCCKEGLDKPPRRPAQRTKRKCEEATVDTNAVPPKAQKLQGVASLTQSTSDRPGKGSIMTSLDRQKAVDFDTMDLECIDLSFTDDEIDDIFKSVGAGSPGKRAGHVPAQTSPVRSAGRGTLPDQASVVSNKGIIAKSKLARTSAEPTSAEKFNRQDECIGHDRLLIDETLFGVTPSSTAGRFKSGASDEVLYQGVPGEFVRTGTNSSPSANVQGNTSLASSRMPKPDNPSSSLFLDDMPGMSPDNSPGGSAMAEPVVSAGASAKVEGRSEPRAVGKEVQGAAAKHSGEPAWVAEFDPEFVDMLRGYVTFV
ncbi:P-loop containing nucleoside triphosphate hydrolase protein [Parathielavia appendiculata]|uniref:DNA 3'-5' helicase n=1 Tax=Parathielavia appendiculata TaxID=2587402 RepID=A0AAN6TS37_9PEZI|nr:P-loop containing nucleoside triphosphate hydrolase protein [Parathielavia appendiculata]